MILNGLEGLLVKIAREKKLLTLFVYIFESFFDQKNCSKTYLPKNFESMQMVFSQNLIVLDRGQNSRFRKYLITVYENFPGLLFRKYEKYSKFKFLANFLTK